MINDGATENDECDHVGVVGGVGVYIVSGDVVAGDGDAGGYVATYVTE